jgi:UDP-N-acetylmuramoylalanine--D-glutamate ligase
VYELSSFQLWDIKRSPDIGVCLLIEPDHLNVHESMEEYVDAKANIARFQREDDAFFFHPTNSYAAAIALKTVAHTNARYNCSEDMPSVYYDAHDFCYKGEAIVPLEALRLRGDHNKENACAALSVAKYMGVENVACEKGLRDFTGLPHRLEFVDEKEGVEYYDDSFSSATPATIVALSAFEQPKVLICGGYDRGLSYEDFAAELAQHPPKIALLIGQTREQLAREFTAHGISHEVCDETDMTAIVRRAAKHTSAGDIVLLSPGAASFDMFTDFSDRGNKFQRAVGEL